MGLWANDDTVTNITGTWSVVNGASIKAVAGSVALVTDVGPAGSLWRSDGTSWRPLNGTVILAQKWGTFASPISTISGSTGTTFVLPANITIPAGLIPPNSRLWISARTIRTGANGTANVVSYVGTTNSSSDSLATQLALTATDQQKQSTDALAMFGTSPTTFVSQGTISLHTSGASGTMMDRSTNVNTAATMYVNLAITSANALDSFALVGYQVMLEA